MRPTLKRLARLTAGYSLVTLAGPLLTILLTPLYTRVLSPADYGVVDVALTLAGLVSILVMLGMDQALSAFFFDGDATYQRNLVTTAILCVGALGVALGAGLAVVAAPLAQLLFKDVGRSHIIYLLTANVVSVPVYSVIAAALRLQMGVKRVNVLGLSFLAATVASNVVLVLVFRLQATGVVTANVLANLCACGVALALARQSLRGTFSPALLRPLARAGVGLLPGAFSLLLLMNVDRLLLTQFVSQSDIGLYAIAYKLASMVYVTLSAMWSAWWPMALEMAGQPDATRQYARMFEYVAAASMFLALGLGSFAPEILAVFTREAYVPAAPYGLALMVYSGPLDFMARTFHIGLYVRKRTHLVSATYLVAAIVNIVLNLVLDPFVGVWGAVCATILAWAMLMVSAYILSQRALHVPYRLRRVSLLFALYLGWVLAFLLAPALQSAAIKVGALAVLAIAVLAVGVITPSQVHIGFEALRYRMSHPTQAGK